MHRTPPQDRWRALAALGSAGRPVRPIRLIRLIRLTRLTGLTRLTRLIRLIRLVRVVRVVRVGSIDLAIVVAVVLVIATCSYSNERASATSQPAGQTARQHGSPTADAIRAHISFLADDLLRGREPGTPEFKIAANYVASQFRRAGLGAAGDAGGYFQTVRLRTTERDHDAARMQIHAAGTT